MNTIDFCFFLQGFFELTDVTEINAEQTQKIKNHLSLVFRHEIDPLRESETDTPKEVLDEAHSPSNGANHPHNDPLLRC